MIDTVVDVSATVASLQQFAVELEQGASQLLRESLELAVEFARKAPQPFTPRTGKLNRSIGYRMTGPLSGRIFTDRSAPYAGWIEYGRGPVRPVNGAFLRFNVGGRWVTTKFSRPAAARPFIRPAVEHESLQLESKLLTLVEQLAGYQHAA